MIKEKTEKEMKRQRALYEVNATLPDTAIFDFIYDPQYFRETLESIREYHEAHPGKLEYKPEWGPRKTVSAYLLDMILDGVPSSTPGPHQSWHKHRAGQAMVSSFVFADPVDRETLDRAASEEIPINARQLKAKIFYERFFRQRSNKEVAADLGMADNACSAIYQKARDRVMQIVSALDGREHGLKFIAKRGCQFSDDERYFLLNKIFGLSVAELARMPGAPTEGALKRRLRLMYYQYKEQMPSPA